MPPKGTRVFNISLTILQVFEVLSGLKINPEKCSLVGIHLRREDVSFYASLVVWRILFWPLPYLGI